MSRKFMIEEHYLDQFPPFQKRLLKNTQGYFVNFSQTIHIHIVNDIQGDKNTDGNERKS